MGHWHLNGSNPVSSDYESSPVLGYPDHRHLQPWHSETKYPLDTHSRRTLFTSYCYEVVAGYETYGQCRFITKSDYFRNIMFSNFRSYIRRPLLRQPSLTFALLRFALLFEQSRCNTCSFSIIDTWKGTSIQWKLTNYVRSFCDLAFSILLMTS